VSKGDHAKLRLQLQHQANQDLIANCDFDKKSVGLW
jgi:hypothetical protein